MYIGQNVVRYVSNSSWSKTITNENTYWTIIIFNFDTVITFFFLFLNGIFYFWLFLLDFSIDFLILYCICILLTVFQRFDELAFSLCGRVFCCFQTQYFSYVNKPTTYRCCRQEVLPTTYRYCRQEVLRQIGVRSVFKKL